MKQSLIRDEIFAALRHRIRSGSLKPGTPLLEQQLSRDFRVSRTPLREALFDLEKQGYLTKGAQRSFVVKAGKHSKQEAPPSSAPPPPTLRDQAANKLRELILSNVLKENTILRESPLALELGTSRTPAREALLTLVREGLVRKEARRGFRVSPLEAQEVRELYPLRALLEPQALRESGVPEPEDLAVLRDLNHRLNDTRAGANWVFMDNEWHEVLVKKCTNRHLLQFLKRLRQHCLRYELAFLGSRPDQKRSIDQHLLILDQLEAADLQSACETLAANMTISIEPLLERLHEPRKPSV